MKREGVYTIWIFRNGAFRPHKIKLPGFIAKTLLIVFLVIIFSFPFITFSYISKSLKLAKMEKERAEQKVQMASLNKKLVEFRRQIQKLKEFDVKLRIIANLENAEETGSFLGVGGLAHPYREPWQKEADLKRMGAELDRLCTEAKFCERSFRELYSFLEGKKRQLACTPSIWPARGWLTSRFGYRIDPFTGLRQFHEGIDIANRIGTPIIAPADGVVSRVYKEFGLGLMLEIKHGYGIVTRYGHLSKVYVKVGRKVKRGERIAAIGNTGRSTGPHLHYEVRLNGVPVNPQRYILN
ncbi:MAG: peptidase M23 [Deltaproteobacteria bacterium]|nr:MAG: peptidase M23 [Deltaproteobacteria bacterium]